jgi:[protein-PII] uridylyltransferase
VQRRTPRKLKYFSIPTRTSISTDFKNGHTVLEVITPDRPGLLARIGRIFVTYGIQLQAAKITTLGERVEDVFFITDYNNEPINDPLLCEDIQRAIRQTLDEKVAEQG